MRAETKNQNDFFASVLAAIDLDENEQDEIAEHNDFADRYNAAVDSILSDAEKQKEFETILDEQKAVLVIDGGMTNSDAETYIRQPENLRRAAMFFMTEKPNLEID